MIRIRADPDLQHWVTLTGLSKSIPRNLFLASLLVLKFALGLQILSIALGFRGGLVDRKGFLVVYNTRVTRQFTIAILESPPHGVPDGGMPLNK
jgi:hypothetical protein